MRRSTLLSVLALLSILAKDLPAPPPPPPVISGVSPSTVSAIGGQTATISGAFLVNVLGVTVDGQAALFSEQGPGGLQFLVPQGKKLGPAVLKVNTNGGSDTTVLTYVAPDLPALIGPASLNNGSPAAFTYGGVPGQLAVLLVNLNGQVIPHPSGPLLVNQLLVPLGSLNALGLGGLTAPISGLPLGMDIYTQILTIDAPGTNLSTLRASNIVQSHVDS